MFNNGGGYEDNTEYDGDYQDSYHGDYYDDGDYHGQGGYQDDYHDQGGYQEDYHGDQGDYDQGCDDMDLEKEDELAGSWRPDDQQPPDKRSSVRPGHWVCPSLGCQEVNFARRERCRRCDRDRNHVETEPEKTTEKSEDEESVKSFDTMFSNWEATYSRWKLENADNPDTEYVAGYTAQMEAVRYCRVAVNSRRLLASIHSKVLLMYYTLKVYTLHCMKFGLLSSKIFTNGRF